MNELETAILDCNSRYYHMDVLQLMENAGRSVAEEIEKQYGQHNDIGIFCGTGNNGGDGFVTARFLCQHNKVTVYLVGNPKAIRTPEAMKNWNILEHSSVTKEFITDSTHINIFDHDILVDALLGTGITGKLREPYKTLVTTLNSKPGAKISVDVPTGWETSTAFAAEKVISMHYAKTEDCTTVSIGVPQEFESLVGPGDVKFLQRRREDSHKGDNGKILIIGGSHVYHGAVVYAAAAASLLVDLVIIACPKSAADVIKEASPDFIVHPLSSDHLVSKDISLITELAASCDAVLMGPGLGTGTDTKKTCQALISDLTLPIVIDADGLKALENKTTLLNERIVLTPHRGEFALLFKDQSPAQAAAAHKCTIVRKGPVDVISNGEKTKYNYTGNAGMTTGGTGDVLSGLIAGFSATSELFQASCAGTFVNGAAGDRCYQQYGFYYTSSDVVEHLQPVLKWCTTF